MVVRGAPAGKIKEALARKDEFGYDDFAPAVGTPAAEDRALLLAAVPDLITEIERLKDLAHEGWGHAADVYYGDGVEPVPRVSSAMKEIEVTS